MLVAQTLYQKFRLQQIQANMVLQNIIAPPFNYLLMDSGAGDQSIVPAPYAVAAKAAGLDIITWTFERSGPLAGVKADDDYYYTSVADAVHTDGQLYETL